MIEIYLDGSTMNDKPLISILNDFYNYSVDDKIYIDNKVYKIVSIFHRVVSQYDINHYIIVRELC